MARWGMVVDLDRCNGCQACDRLPVREQHCRRRTAGRRRTPDDFVDARAHGDRGEWPEVRARFVPQPCMHCDRPPCTLVCPVQATSKDNEGIVNQIYARCIGCRYCANACPYTVKFFNWHGPVHPSSAQPGLNPDVSVRPVGVVEKCTFCSHRLQKAREIARVEHRQLREHDYMPACAESCPTRAIVFGNLDDPSHRVAELARDSRAFRLQEGLGTQPKVFYLSRRD